MTEQYNDPKFLSYFDLKLAMVKAIEERGENYIYKADPRFQPPDGSTACSYAQADYLSPTDADGLHQVVWACAVGAIWDKTGVVDLDSAVDLQATIQGLLDYEFVTSDPQGQTFLVIIQDLQDSGFPWGICYDVAAQYADTVETAADYKNIVGARDAYLRTASETYCPQLHQPWYLGNVDRYAASYDLRSR